MDNKLDKDDFAQQIIKNVETFTLKIATKEKLHSLYLPFIKNGGIFVATKQSFQLGDKVIVSLTLLDDPAIYTIESQVVWINPSCAQEGLPEGVGVQFNPNERNTIQIKIENILAGYTGTTSRTDTM
jgi:type IV pilus assembly protein PilZ